MASNRNKAGWIYVLDSDIEAHREDDYRIFKIGRATSLKSRVKQLGTLYCYKPTIAYTFPVENAIESEAELHDLFRTQRLNGEWFRLGFEDLTFISDYAGNCGYFEATNGSLIPDPLRPVTDAESIRAAIAELENDKNLALRSKYFPLQPLLDLPVCIIESEEVAPYSGPTEEEEAEEYERYIEECRHQEELEAEEQAKLQMEIEEEDGGWDHTYDRDEDFIEITEEQREYLHRKMIESLSLTVTEDSYAS